MTLASRSGSFFALSLTALLGCQPDAVAIPPEPTADTNPPPGSAEVRLNEFLASNVSGLTDGSGAFPDWVELHNVGDATADLSGWFLTDDPLRPTRWAFPEGVVLAAGDYLVVFCDADVLQSDLDELHTNFRLAATGENLALFGPTADGTPLVDEVLAWPQQLPDVSWALRDGEWGPADPPSPGAAN